jgi:hypothetical protein
MHRGAASHRLALARQSTARPPALPILPVKLGPAPWARSGSSQSA